MLVGGVALRLLQRLEVGDRVLALAELGEAQTRVVERVGDDRGLGLLLDDPVVLAQGALVVALAVEGQADLEHRLGELVVARIARDVGPEEPARLLVLPLLEEPLGLAPQLVLVLGDRGRLVELGLERGEATVDVAAQLLEREVGRGGDVLGVVGGAAQLHELELDVVHTNADPRL